ncbi:hypothetical protein PAPHI01_2353 [Pancytospora philotis]|nr:hypothetical protein PAPHI01_2353 [Pancytospora philotis]
MDAEPEINDNGTTEIEINDNGTAEPEINDKDSVEIEINVKDSGKQQRKTLAFKVMLLTAFCTVPFIVASIYTAMACMLQARHYAAHGSAARAVWEKYGMPKSSYALSMAKVEEMATAALHVCIVGVPLIAGCILAAVRSHDTAPGSTVCRVLEGLLFFIAAILTGLGRTVYKLLTLNFVSLCVSACAVALLWGFVGKKFGFMPFAVLGALLLSNLMQACLILLNRAGPADVLGTLFDGEVSRMHEFPDVSAKVRDRILSFCAKNGLKRDEVFVVDDLQAINAAACSGPRFKFIFFTTAILKVLPTDCLIATAAHELGHIKHGHTTMFMSIHMSLAAALIVLAAFLHYRMHKAYGSAAMMLLTLSTFIGVMLFAQPVLNLLLFNPSERQADQHAIDLGLAKPLAEGLRLLSISASNGAFFDYEQPFATLRNHPAMLKRMRMCERAAPALVK